MKDMQLQSALREWRAHMAHPARVIALAGIAVILTILAPFETGKVMTALPRLAYWAALVVLSYCIGYSADRIAARLAPDNIIKRVIIAGTLTAIGAFILVYALNVIALHYWASGMEFLFLAVNVSVISVIIAAIIQFAYASTGQDIQSVSVPPAILERLPLEKRGKLVSLSVEDHYVHVRTVKGEEMILMRLADAIKEVGETPGLQVHRSHWIALDQVISATRKGDGAVLRMANGPEIPVSRANLPKAKAAGLLPR